MGLVGTVLGALGGDVASSAFGAYETRAARKFTKMMSDTAHYREVKDLRRAGLNPILSAGGSGASTPSTPATPIPQASKSITGGISSAVAAKQAKADVAIKGTQLESNVLDVAHQKGMYEWLKQNPKFQDLYYASRLSKSAGLNPSLFGPIMATNSAERASKSKSAVDRFWDAIKNRKPWEMKGVWDSTAWEKTQKQRNQDLKNRFRQPKKERR